MKVNKLTLIPAPLQNIPQPPASIYHAGAQLAELLSLPRVAIVGSRRTSSYGRQVTSLLASQLAGQGIVIVSGLALGIDTVAHESALAAGGRVIAVLPSPIENIVPASNQRLAERIVQQGGAIISEYPEGSVPYKLNFVERNRLMSGISDAVLITEAAKRSGSLHTAAFALDQGKEVLAVPGNVNNAGSEGTNQLIKNGAGLVTDFKDVLFALGLHQQALLIPKSDNPNEQLVLNLICRGISSNEELLNASKFSVQEFNQVITGLEVAGKIRWNSPDNWAIS